MTGIAGNSKAETRSKSLTRRTRSRRRVALALAASAMTALATFRTAHAATQIFWDADGSASGNTTSSNIGGGNGTQLWNTTATDWWLNGGPSDTTWNSADQAVITGGTSILNLSSGIIASAGIQTYVTTTILTGNASALTLSGTYAMGTISEVNTISAPIAGSGFTFFGNTGDTLVLSGANTFNGTFTQSNNQVNINSSTALGTANYVINGGAIDTNGQTLLNNNTQTWNSSFTFGGSGNLNMGSGAVSLGTTNVSSYTLTTNASTFTVGGVISNGTFANSLVKAGAGSLALTGASTFTGGMTLNAGTLDIDNSGSSSSNSAIGTGTLNLSGGNIDNTLGSLVTLATNNAQTWTNDFTFVGSNNLDLGTGAVSLGTATGTTRTVTVNNNTLSVGGIISNGTSTSLTKAGTGTLLLYGADAYTGTTTVNAGTLSLSGTLASPSLVLNGGTFSVTAAQAGQTFTSGTTVSGTGSAVVANYANGSTLALGAITRTVPGTVDFTLPTSGSITTSTANANFAGGQQSILGGYATVGGTSWAVSGSGATPGAISALSTYSPTFTAATDVDAPTSPSAPGTMTINSLRFNNAGSSIPDSGGGDTLTIATGGILETTNVGGNSVTISPVNLTSGNGMLRRKPSVLGACSVARLRSCGYKLRDV